MRGKKLAVLAVAVIAAAAGVWALVVRSEPVEVAAIRRGPARSVVEEEGKTRVAERYVVSAPVSGRLLRIGKQEGDPVGKGETVATIEDLPFTSAAEEARARIRGIAARLAGVARLRPKPDEILRAGVEQERAKAAEAQAGEARDEARATAEQAHRDADRARALFAQRTIPEAEKEDAELAETRARAALASAEAMVRIRTLETRIAGLGRQILEESAHDVDWQEDQAKADLAAARAGLAVLEDELGRTKIASPAAGTILRRFHESQAVVSAGTPILEIGDLGDLEVEADLLSEDAARMKPGLKVEVYGRALGDETLAGTLDRIYPAAFTKVSSLGVEQQRTTVVVRLKDRPPSLGDRYRVDVRVILEEKPDVILVPEAALFREGGEWRAFAVEGGRARKRTVRTGIRDGRNREVLGGLAEGDRVVLFPPDDLADGDRVHATAGGGGD